MTKDLAPLFIQIFIVRAGSLPASAQKTIVERLVRAILTRRVFPLQAMLDDINDATDDLPVIDPRNTMRTWKEGLDTFELFGRKGENLAHGFLLEHN